MAPARRTCSSAPLQHEIITHCASPARQSSRSSSIKWPFPCFASAQDMRAFSHWILTLFASPMGVVALAALDSTLFFSLPFGIDAAVIILAARLRDFWWTVPLLASAGSVGGAALTFWMGRKIGENGLDRFVPKARLERIRNRIKNSGAVAL